MSFSITIDDFVFIEEPVVHYQSPHRVTEVENMYGIINMTPFQNTASICGMFFFR